VLKFLKDNKMAKFGAKTNKAKSGKIRKVIKTVKPTRKGYPKKR
jgi:hypothetical protein